MSSSCPRRSSRPALLAWLAAALTIGSACGGGAGHADASPDSLSGGDGPGDARQDRPDAAAESHGGAGDDGDAGDGETVCHDECTPGARQCGDLGLMMCTQQEGGCATWTRDPCAPGLVCERAGEATCVDASWTRWAMPNSPRDVLEGAPNPPRYTDVGDGTVKDEVTGLIWQKAIRSPAAIPPVTFTLEEAVSYCYDLSLGGRSDWRLPTAIELVSLVDYGRYLPSIDTGVFPDTPSEGFLSGTVAIIGTRPIVWTVSFDYGQLAAYDTSGGLTRRGRVRCVR